MISFAECAKSAIFSAFQKIPQRREKRVQDTYLISHLRATFKRQTLVFAVSAIICSLISPPADAKGLFGSDEKDPKSPTSLPAQLYQIQQQLTQLQAQMTQLQLQMNKRTTVIEQKQNSLHETLTQQASVLKSLAKEEHQIEQQVQAAAKQAEPVAAKQPPAHAQHLQQPTLEESADYEVARVNTKATPAYKSHIQDVESQEVAAAVAQKKTSPIAIAAKAPAAPPMVAEAKKALAAKKAEEKAAKLAEEKTDAAKSTGRLLPGFFGDRLSKAKKDTPAQTQPSLAEAPAQRNLNSGKPRVKASITIKASPEVVWDAVHEQRKTDPELAYSKVLRQGVNEATLEQKFMVIPVIGSAVCTMNTQEVPNRRIDYQMIKSDRFKAMEGSWVLTPSADGKSTTLELSSHVDLGLPVPRGMMNGVTQKKLERRLAHVRELAEKSRVAQKPGGGAQ